MESGRFDKRVTLETCVQSVDAYGSPTEVYNVAGNRWAMIRDLTGREQWMAEQASSIINKVVELREEMPGLASKDRVLYGMRVFEIVAVLGERERDPRRGQTLQCREVVV